ncbi:hypothetical protein Poli38472_012826 [Pythium oligandrum]|uniref:SWIM-type domain-containing protein n=1 Tax=Pythium oligandrum TaxID=41045 RepID=A0A8K1CJI2_PYTOL|nr:hypothetical protein Poli38472_012826 [Pythium oligandrum]|eukprot:TMW64204.1 hypothetical protein Poli38472_012826 [Pythium oligandrum]
MTPTLRKEERFGTFNDAVAVIESFALDTQQRRVRVQQQDAVQAAAEDGSGGVFGDADDAASQANVVVVECENAPECKWFVRLSYIKSEKKWKISSMNTVHHKTHCIESQGLTDVTTASFQRLMRDDVLPDMVPVTPTPAVSTTTTSIGGHINVGMKFSSWKEGVAAVRALAHQMGRRAVAEKPSEMLLDGRTITVRRVVCQNHRNSNCEWMVVLEEATDGTENYTVLSMHLLHSKECLETRNFSARKKDQAQKAAASAPGENLQSMNPAASLLVDDLTKYQLTHEMRWSTGKEATRAISDFALVVQQKRSKLCKKNNGGSNKKYVCSDEKCLWFVQLVKGWKSKNWKISAMNLKHSENCTGEAKPTARQLAEMRFFRQAVITHSKSNGKLLTDSFLMNSESGIKIPRGMAYRAQRLVVATSTDDLTESYKFIPSLLDSFGKKNPGSAIAYEKDEMDHFVRAFIMPNAMSLSLLCMQQVFGIKILNYDSVSYTGSVALLIGRDGNLQSQVLAFALLPNSEMDHMKWFLSLAKAGGVRFDGCPVFCSHNQNGLLRALAHEARNAKIMFCVRSLVEEINRDKNIPNLGALEELIWDMQNQETEEGFAKVLSQLESLNAPAAAFIRAVHPKNWAYHLNRSIRLYKWSSTAAEEAIHGSDVQNSDEAPFDLMYGFLAFLMDNIFKKNQLAQKLLAENPLLTPGVDAVYRQELQESELYTVRLCDEQVAFTWRTGERPKITHRVDLSLRTCTCGQMYQLGIPCRHFIAVSLHFASEATLMDGFDTIYKAAAYAEVCRNLRIEIPAAEDLSKDTTILPAASLKGNKYKKRARSAVPQDPRMSAAMLQPLAKTPRLDFDADVVTGLTELV